MFPMLGSPDRTRSDSEQPGPLDALGKRIQLPKTIGSGLTSARSAEFISLKSSSNGDSPAWRKSSSLARLHGMGVTSLIASSSLNGSPTHAQDKKSTGLSDLNSHSPSAASRLSNHTTADNNGIGNATIPRCWMTPTERNDTHSPRTNGSSSHANGNSQKTDNFQVVGTAHPANSHTKSGSSHINNGSSQNKTGSSHNNVTRHSKESFTSSMTTAAAAKEQRGGKLLARSGSCAESQVLEFVSPWKEKAAGSAQGGGGRGVVVKAASFSGTSAAAGSRPIRPQPPTEDKNDSPLKRYRDAQKRRSMVAAAAAATAGVGKQEGSVNSGVVVSVREMSKHNNNNNIINNNINCNNTSGRRSKDGEAGSHQTKSQTTPVDKMSRLEMSARLTSETLAMRDRVLPTQDISGEFRVGHTGEWSTFWTRNTATIPRMIVQDEDHADFIESYRKERQEEGEECESEDAGILEAEKREAEDDDPSPSSVLRRRGVAARQSLNLNIDPKLSPLLDAAMNKVDLGVVPEVHLSEDKDDGVWGSMMSLWADDDPVKKEKIKTRSHYLKSLKTPSQMYSWGHGKMGQLGHGDCKAAFKPKNVRSFVGVPIASMAVGNKVSAVISTNGQLHMWGCGEDGQLGAGTYHSTNTPQEVQLPICWLNGFTSVACGRQHTVAVTGSGELLCWGFVGEHNWPSPRLILRSKIPILGPACEWRAKMVACGTKHSAVVTEAGLLMTWGCGAEGRLGLGGLCQDVTIPTPVQDWCFSRPNLPHGPTLPRDDGPLPVKVTSVSCGDAHTAVIVKGGAVYTCGAGKYGRLGLGTTRDTCIMTLVQDDLYSADVTQVSCGQFHTAAVTSSGAVYTWGCGDNGQLGLGEPEEEDEGPPKLFNVSGALWKPTRPEDTLPESKSRPSRVPTLCKHFITKVSCGGRHTAVITEDGELWVWGMGLYGQLGIQVNKHQRPRSPFDVKAADTDQDTAIPERVDVKYTPWGTPLKVDQVVCGAFHTTALVRVGGSRDRGSVHEGMDEADSD